MGKTELVSGIDGVALMDAVVCRGSGGVVTAINRAERKVRVAFTPQDVESFSGPWLSYDEVEVA